MHHMATFGGLQLIKVKGLTAEIMAILLCLVLQINVLSVFLRFFSFPYDK